MSEEFYGRAKIDDCKEKRKLILQTSTAGAFAGSIEHLITFPFDTLKTRLQYYSLRNTAHNVSTGEMLVHVLKGESVARLYRGLTAILIGAIPSHALYFTTYEVSKSFFGISSTAASNPHLVVVCGALATMAHDSVVTPLDVIKQKMQLPMTKGNFLVIAKKIMRSEGPLFLFRSLPTTVLINIPYQGVYFVTYETVKVALQKINFKNKKWPSIYYI